MSVELHSTSYRAFVAIGLAALVNRVRELSLRSRTIAFFHHDAHPPILFDTYSITANDRYYINPVS